MIDCANHQVMDIYEDHTTFVPVGESWEGGDKGLVEVYWCSKCGTLVEDYSYGGGRVLSPSTPLQTKGPDQTAAGPG